MLATTRVSCDHEVMFTLALRRTTRRLFVSAVKTRTPFDPMEKPTFPTRETGEESMEAGRRKRFTSEAVREEGAMAIVFEGSVQKAIVKLKKRSPAG